MTVNKERVRLLVDALRSGEFKQAKGQLRTPDERYHCCLGVATEVALRGGLVVHDRNHGYPWSQATQIMCAEVYTWYGFEEGNPVLVGELGWDYKATHWNDELDSTFDQIAHLFEINYLADEADAA